jgi:predicted nucleotidyltransferase
MVKQELIVKDKRPLMDRIREYVNVLDAELGVDQAFLYGSTARGKRRRNSDVDIIVVSECFAKMPEPKRWGLLQHLWRYKEDLETLAYTPNEFAKIKERLLMQKILQYAIDLTPREKHQTL